MAVDEIAEVLGIDTFKEDLHEIAVAAKKISALLEEFAPIMRARIEKPLKFWSGKSADNGRS